MTETAIRTDTPPAGAGERKQLAYAGWMLGFALGGFFDGILLHQVLQWHHLLSALQGEAFQDLRVQILADGLFHALMYVLAAVGLWLLWRARRAFSGPGSGSLLVADLLIGFGAWHIVDAIVSHWVLGIHRIRMDTNVPLVWDLAWFFLFGVVFVIAGWMLRRRAGGSDGPAARSGMPVAVVLAVLGAGSLAALPPPDTPIVVVVFVPGTPPEQMIAGLASVDGRTVWTDASGEVWAMDVPADVDTTALYRHGALMVSRGLLPLACLDWVRV